MKRLGEEVAQLEQDLFLEIYHAILGNQKQLGVDALTANLQRVARNQNKPWGQH